MRIVPFNSNNPHYRWIEGTNNNIFWWPLIFGHINISFSVLSLQRVREKQWGTWAYTKWSRHATGDRSEAGTLAHCIVKIVCLNRKSWSRDDYRIAKVMSGIYKDNQQRYDSPYPLASFINSPFTFQTFSSETLFMRHALFFSFLLDEIYSKQTTTQTAQQIWDLK